MSELITRTARLVPYAKRPKQVASFVTAYSYEPLADEPGARLGSLYVVMEVLISGRASEEVGDLIIETIGDHYYNQGHGDSDPLNRFEAAIKATNQELGEHVNRGNAAWIGKLSAIAAIQVGDELHVAQTGSAEAFLYRGKAATHVSAGGATRPATPTKTFGSIATGQLEPGDRLLLATPALIHQIPLEKLQSIITHSGPNAAIAELTQLLHGTSTDRIASLIIEITTPELAALQVRSEEPSEIQLGTPENAFEAAKMAAAPLAQTTVTSGKRVATATRTGWNRAKPHAKEFGLAVADKIRQALSTKGGRRTALIGLVVVVAILAGLIWYHQSTAQSAKLFSTYQTRFQEFQHGQQLLDSGDKTTARSVFGNLQQELTKLKGNQAKIDAQLGNHALLDSEPRTYNALTLLVADRLNQIDGLVQVEPVNIVSFTAKNSRPNHFELAGNNAYIFDAGNNNAISIVNVVTSSIRASKTDTSKLGDVIGTTLSSANDGIFILTAKPSVWFYRFDTDSLTEQTITYGTWPKATAIASYTSNLYLLNGTDIYKHTKNATGFSPKTSYLSSTGSDSKNATSLAVDGSVYLISSNGLHRYLAGVLKQSAPVPGSLPNIQNLRSVAGGDLIIGVSPTTHRIGLWQVKDTAITFDKQIAPSGINSLYDATYDAKSGNVYATTGNSLVRIPLHP